MEQRYNCIKNARTENFKALSREITQNQDFVWSPHSLYFLTCIECDPRFRKSYTWCIYTFRYPSACWHFIALVTLRDAYFFYYVWMYSKLWKCECQQGSWPAGLKSWSPFVWHNIIGNALIWKVRYSLTFPWLHVFASVYLPLISPTQFHKSTHTNTI